MPTKPLPYLLALATLLAACSLPKRLDDPAQALPRGARPAASPQPIPLMPVSRPAPAPPAPAAALPSAAQASAASDLHAQRYTALAGSELRKTETYSGLTDAQLARIEAARQQLASGHARAAYSSLSALNAELQKATRPYSVKSGDSLWIISAKPEIYGNPWLWPLIWQANLRIVPNPDRLRQGQILSIRPHPTVDEVAKAVETSREHVQRTDTTIGEVREQPR